MEKRYKDKNWLYNEYVVLKQSLREIAEICEVGITVIYTWMKKHNIPRRTPVEAVDIIWKDNLHRNKEWLQNQYITLKKSTCQIEKEFGICHSLIGRWLKKFNISVRNKSEALMGKKLGSEHRLKVIAAAVPFPKGEAHPNWVGGFQIEQKCEVCGTLFITRKDWVVEGKGRFCSYECRYEGMSGENSAAWKGGKSLDPYPKEFNSALKRRVCERDNYVCQVRECADDKTGVTPSVHHIDYDKENNDINNLVTLCCSCHGKTNYNRNEWIEYFSVGVGRR